VIDRDPVRNFEAFWKTFYDRYPFFELHGVDWRERYEIFRPRVTADITDEQLFMLLCELVSPLDDGHIEIEARVGPRKKKKFFTPEKKPRFYEEFSDDEIEDLFKITSRTLVANGFDRPRKTQAWMLKYGRSSKYGYIRILELEDIRRRTLTKALDDIARDFDDLKGFIVDIRDCPGGDDSTALMIINRFCDRKRTAFHRQTKTGPRPEDYSPIKTWYLEPQGDSQFTGPIALLTCDAVFSGGESFALAMRELPYVTIIGARTNGIFSYTLDKRLPNGWKYCLSYQRYMSADMICYEGEGVPVDIELLNKRSDLSTGEDPLISRALQILEMPYA